MRLVHTAIRVSSSANAERFYEKLLGFELVREYEIGEDLTKKLFGIEKDFLIRLYKFGDVFPEVFVGKENSSAPKVEHICLEIGNRESLKKKAEKMGFETAEVEREGKVSLIFIYDDDGNVFELKT